MKKAVQIHRIIISVFIMAGLLLFAAPMNNAWSSEVAAKQVILKVEGMSCATCPATVKAALKRLSRVINADVSFKEAKATVSYYKGKVTVEQMIKAIEDVGYHAYLITGEKQ